VTQSGESRADEVEADLLRRLRAGGAQADEALLELFEQHRRPWLARLRGHGATLAQAEDLLHDAFVKARKALPTFRGDAKVTTWIYAIARNALHDERDGQWREVRVQAQDEDDTEDPLVRLADAVAAAPSAEDDFELARLRRCLSEHYPAFVRDHPERADDLELIVTEGLRDRELAELRGVSEGTMRKRLQRTRELLKDYLLPCAGHYTGRLL